MFNRKLLEAEMRTLMMIILLVSFGASAALADSVFLIEDPPVDFEVIDYDPLDGNGDVGPFATFNDALIGTDCVARSMAEFDISTFSVPPGDIISSATFEVMITDVGIFGCGVNGETPAGIAVDGYIANGLEELSDFEAGDGNNLNSVATPTPQIGQVLSFDVTAYVTDLVNAQESYVGLTVRAESFGGLMFEEGNGYPKLAIETTTESPVPTLSQWGMLIMGLLLLAIGTVAEVKKRRATYRKASKNFIG